MHGIIEAQRIERRKPSEARVGVHSGYHFMDSLMARQRLTLAMASPQSIATQTPVRRLVARANSPVSRQWSATRQPSGNNVAGNALPETGPRFDTLIPPCVYALILAIPLAMIALSLLLNTVIDVRSIFARSYNIAIPVTDIRVAAMETSTLSTELNGEPLSIDATEFTSIRRTEYEVEPGDTISGIAHRFGLRAGTILSMNPIDDVRRLLPGTMLSIPDRDGVFHAVQPGDSVYSIAEAYGVSMTAILDANDIATPVLHVGEPLFVPGAEMEETDYLLAIGELLHWPVRSSRFTSGYGMREDPITGIWRMHSGIDLANVVGTPILAARSGRVVYVEDQVVNYGKMIIIDHGGGTKTLYAHLDSFMVSYGDRVSTGQQIATMGNSGRSTGPHLHFSVFRNDRMEDPLKHLP